MTTPFDEFLQRIAPVAVSTTMAALQKYEENPGYLVVHRQNRLESTFEWRGGPLAIVTQHYWGTIYDYVEMDALPWTLCVIGSTMRHGEVVLLVGRTDMDWGMKPKRVRGE